MDDIKNWLYFSLEELIDMETNDTKNKEESPYDRTNVASISDGSSESSANNTE